ncbi:hypothetical protein ACFQX4_19270 [Roseomonas sp. GCM10028921]
MSFDADRLATLLPALYRLRDAERGGPLAELLSILAGQAAVLEEDLAQLYDDQFIETCAEWVVPYIGDLVGARTLFVPEDAAFSQRAQVANTLAYRRRKGTAALLEQLARDTTGWDAAVVEFFQRLATTQYMNHIRPDNLSWAALRPAAPLEWTGTPFETAARTADVRRIEPRRGRHNIPNIGLFLYRIASDPITDAMAFRVDDFRYRFDPLGRDLPLYNRAVTETEITQLAGPANVPLPLGRRRLSRELELHYGLRTRDHPARGLLLAADGREILAEASSPPARLRDLVRICDLSDLTDPGGNVLGWAHADGDRIAIDPVLGRIAFPPGRLAPTGVRVSYHQGLAGQIGGGGYGRAATFTRGLAPVIRVPGDAAALQLALDQLAASGGVVEITRNDVFAEALAIRVAAGRSIELRAADKLRPVILPLGGMLEVYGGAESEVVLNGLLVAGGVAVPASGPAGRNRLRVLRIRHCSLVPGAVAPMRVGALSTPGLPPGPRLRLEPETAEAEIRRSILGPVAAAEGARVVLADSILDAGAEDAVAHAAADGAGVGAVLEAENATIVGRVHAAMLHASGCIFLARADAAAGWAAPVLAARLQEGCVRFSYLPPGARVPRPYRCQPANAADAARMRPAFASLRFGDPGYGQLSRQTAAEIREGAEDGAEMGTFHHLFQPQREGNLRVRLDEYLRFGLEAGIFYVS